MFADVALDALGSVLEAQRSGWSALRETNNNKLTQDTISDSDRTPSDRPLDR